MFALRPFYLIGRCRFSHWNNDGEFFYSTGYDFSNGDGVKDTNGGWIVVAVRMLMS